MISFVFFDYGTKLKILSEMKPLLNTEIFEYNGYFLTQWFIFKSFVPALFIDYFLAIWQASLFSQCHWIYIKRLLKDIHLSRVLFISMHIIFCKHVCLYFKLEQCDKKVVLLLDFAFSIRFIYNKLQILKFRKGVLVPKK